MLTLSKASRDTSEYRQLRITLVSIWIVVPMQVNYGLKSGVDRLFCLPEQDEIWAEKPAHQG
jgi:hypothetical protein